MCLITVLTPPAEYFPLPRKAGGEGEDHREATVLFSLLWQAGYTLGWGSLLCKAMTGTLSTSPASGFTKYLACSLIIFGMKTALSKCHEPPFSLIKLTTWMEPERLLNMRNHSMKCFQCGSPVNLPFSGSFMNKKKENMVIWWVTSAEYTWRILTWINHWGDIF